MITLLNDSGRKAACYLRRNKDQNGSRLLVDNNASNIFKATKSMSIWNSTPRRSIFQHDRKLKTTSSLN